MFQQHNSSPHFCWKKIIVRMWPADNHPTTQQQQWCIFLPSRAAFLPCLFRVQAQVPSPVHARIFQKVHSHHNDEQPLLATMDSSSPSPLPRQQIVVSTSSSLVLLVSFPLPSFSVSLSLYSSGSGSGSSFGYDSNGESISWSCLKSNRNTSN